MQRDRGRLAQVVKERFLVILSREIVHGSHHVPECVIQGRGSRARRRVRSSADPVDSLPVMGAVGATDSGPCMHTGVAPLRANNLPPETRIGSGSTASSGPQPSTAAVLLVRGGRRGRYS